MKDDTPIVLECPECRTRYEVPVAIPEDGRKVRCARCENIWTVMPGDEVRPGDYPAWEGEDQDLVFRGGQEAGAADDGGGANVDAPADPVEDEIFSDASEPEPAPHPPPEAASEAVPEMAGEPVPGPGPAPQSDTAFDGDAGEEAGGLAAIDELFEADTPPETDEPEGEFEPGPAPEEPPVEENFTAGSAAGEPEDFSGTGESAGAEGVEDTGNDTPRQDAEFGIDSDTGGPDVDVAAAVAEFYGDSGQPEEAADGDRPGEGEQERIVIGKAKRKLRFSPRVAAGWAGLCLAVASLSFLAVSQRVAVVRALPGSAALYESVGLPVNVRGLDFRDMAYSWQSDLGRTVLEVHGDIVNVTQETMKVPTVVFGLRDENGVEVYQWTQDVLKEPLPPGKGATFAARIPTPPKSIKSVQVRFAR